MFCYNSCFNKYQCMLPSNNIQQSTPRENTSITLRRSRKGIPHTPSDRVLWQWWYIPRTSLSRYMPCTRESFSSLSKRESHFLAQHVCAWSLNSAIDSPQEKNSTVWVGCVPKRGESSLLFSFLDYIAKVKRRLTPKIYHDFGSMMTADG